MQKRGKHTGEGRRTGEEQRGGRSERSRAEKDRRGVERKEKRSRAEGGEKETLSYIGPNAAVPISDVSLNKLPLFQSAAIQLISNVVVPVCGISGINLPLSVTTTLNTTLVNSLACKLT